jgi:quinol monooxygenase YgiN
MMILIIGRFTIKANEREAFQAFAKEAIEHSKQTAGCLSFEILKDIAKEDAYMMLESWQDRVSLNRHFDTEAYIEGDAKLSALLVGEAAWEEYEV